MQLVTRKIRTLPPALAGALCLTMGGCANTGTTTGTTIGTTIGTNQAMTHRHNTIDYIEFTVLDMAEAGRIDIDTIGLSSLDDLGITGNDLDPGFGGGQTHRCHNLLQ